MRNNKIIAPTWDAYMVGTTALLSGRLGNWNRLWENKVGTRSRATGCFNVCLPKVIMSSMWLLSIRAGWVPNVCTWSDQIPIHTIYHAFTHNNHRITQSVRPTSNPKSRIQPTNPSNKSPKTSNCNSNAMPPIFPNPNPTQLRKRTNTWDGWQTAQEQTMMWFSFLG